MSTKSFAKVLTLLNSGELSDAAFSRALKKLSKVELRALHDSVVAGGVGTPRERFRAKATKEEIDRFMVKFSQLPVQEQSQIWLELTSGKNSDYIL